MHPVQNGNWHHHEFGASATHRLQCRGAAIEENGTFYTEDAHLEKREWRKKHKPSFIINTFLVGLVIVYIVVVKWRPLIIQSTEHRYSSAAVASDATICSTIGTRVLKEHGGSAVDAAIATLFCMGAANLHSMGIGGGFFATIYDSQSKTVSVLDAREVAPGLSRSDYFVHNPEHALTGAMAVGVPGEVAGYWAMHQRYGRLPWSQLLQPTIDMCEEGFEMEAALGRAFQSVINKGRLSEDLWPIVFHNYSRGVRKEGHMMECRRLAKTLRVLAKEGGRSFYNGSLAKDVADDIQEKGGIITEADLRDYKVRWRKPITLDLQDGSTLYAPPAPAGGGVLALILNILQGYRFNNESLLTTEKSVLTYHRLTEAMKFAHAYKTNLGDPDFVDVEQLEKQMVSPDFGDDIRAKIDDTRTFGTEYYGDTPYREVKPGTAHLSLIDSDGNAVAVTSSLNQYCGSTVVGRRTGIVFNNAIDDFSTPNLTNHFGIEPFPTNFIKPGKRPLSSISPALILNGDKSVRMVTGAAGGSAISSVISQIITRNLMLGQSLGEATDAPRLHHQLMPPVLFMEDLFPREVTAGLESKGHAVETLSTRGSVVQSVLVNDPEVIAVSDDRKGGEPDGY